MHVGFISLVPLLRYGPSRHLGTYEMDVRLPRGRSAQSAVGAVCCHRFGVSGLVWYVLFYDKLFVPAPLTKLCDCSTDLITHPYGQSFFYLRKLSVYGNETNYKGAHTFKRSPVPCPFSNLDRSRIHTHTHALHKFCD